MVALLASALKHTDETRVAQTAFDDFDRVAEVHLPIFIMAQGNSHAPALPVELWGQVASFLTLRESCMLASTCRALWAMDLLSLEVLGREETAPGGATLRLMATA